MFGRLLALFVGVPLLELALLVGIGRRVGLAPTIALVVLTGILGASLARWQGLSVLARLEAATREGRLPALEVLEGLLILIAAAVLLPRPAHRPGRLRPAGTTGETVGDEGGGWVAPTALPAITAVCFLIYALID